MPSPADGAHPGGDSATDFWWDHLAKQAKALREAGFTALWLPPVWKGASGTFSVGFDVFDDYDLGSKNQKGTLPTRDGTREQLERCVAISRANGIDVYIDLVENQRMGGRGTRRVHVSLRGCLWQGRRRTVPQGSQLLPSQGHP